MNSRLLAGVHRGTRMPFVVIVSLSLLSIPLAAQGGMGGGMGGSMGGPGGGRGGRGGPPGGMESPVEMIRTSLESNDPMKFLLDNKKPLALTSAQQDTMKRYRKEMQDMQKPVFKELETIFGEAPSRGRGMGAETRGMSGGMGDGPPSGGRGGEAGGFGDPSNDSTPARRRLPEPAKKLVDKLADIQDSYRDRARAQLTEPQRVQADSIEVVWLAKQRERNKERNESRLPSDILEENLYYTDPIRFMLDLEGPLALSSTQRDSIRQYGMELRGKLRPLFSQLETVETPSDCVEPSERVLVLADQLLDLQDEYRQRARALLTRPQRAQADSIELAWLTQQRRLIEAHVGAK